MDKQIRTRSVRKFKNATAEFAIKSRGLGSGGSLTLS
jgi:hypothetical protein